MTDTAHGGPETREHRLVKRSGMKEVPSRFGRSTVLNERWYYCAACGCSESFIKYMKWEGGCKGLTLRTHEYYINRMLVPPTEGEPETEGYDRFSQHRKNPRFIPVMEAWDKLSAFVSYRAYGGGRHGDPPLESHRQEWTTTALRMNKLGQRINGLMDTIVGTPDPLLPAPTVAGDETPIQQENEDAPLDKRRSGDAGTPPGEHADGSAGGGRTGGDGPVSGREAHGGGRGRDQVPGRVHAGEGGHGLRAADSVGRNVAGAGERLGAHPHEVGQPDHASIGLIGDAETGDEKRVRICRLLEGPLDMLVLVGGTDDAVNLIAEMAAEIARLRSTPEADESE